MIWGQDESLPLLGDGLSAETMRSPWSSPAQSRQAGKAWLKIGLSVPNGCNMRGVLIVRANLILSL